MQTITTNVKDHEIATYIETLYQQAKSSETKKSYIRFNNIPYIYKCNIEKIPIENFEESTVKWNYDFVNNG